MITALNESLNTKSQEEIHLKKGVNLDYLYQTAKKGNADSMLKIANLYSACARDDNDYKKAYEWAVKAMDNGKIEAIYLLGKMHQLGLGCEKDTNLACKYYKQLVKMEDLEEHFERASIGEIYENYSDLLLSKTVRNHHQAKSLYQKAVEYGSHTAGEKINELEKNDSGEKMEKGLLFLYAVMCIITITVAVKMVIKECSEPANHLVDSVIHKALTVQDADAEEAKGETATDGVMFLDEDQGEYEKYHFVTEEEMLTAGYSVCQIQSAVATSEQVADVGAQYGIENTYDGKLYTNWQETEADAGIGQSLSYSFCDNETIRVIGIYLGNGRSEKAYADNNRPETITFKMGKQELHCYFPDENGMKYVMLEEPFTGDKITLTIDSVYQGKSDKNLTCITEIAFYQ